MESETATEIAALKNNLRMVIGELTLLHIELSAMQDVVFGMLTQGCHETPDNPDAARKRAAANRLIRKALENRFLEHEKLSPGSAASLQSIHEQRNPTVWGE